MNPEGQMRLSDSVKLFGICVDMCPEYERVRRIVEDDVKPPECVRSMQYHTFCSTDMSADTRDCAPPPQAAHPRRDAHGKGIRAFSRRHGRGTGFRDSVACCLFGK
jgi:hypothetical protein